MAIKHFVGDCLSVSMIESGKDEDGDPKFVIRIAKETNPDAFMDLGPEEWSELAMVVHMIGETHKMMGVPHLIIQQRPSEEGGNDDDSTPS